MITPFKQVLIGFCKEEMIRYLESNPQDFEEAVELAINDEQPFSWRAAWLLWDVVEKNDIRLKKHLSRIIQEIPSKKDGQQRDLLRVVSVMELTEEQECLLFDICTKLWLSISSQPTARYWALLTMLRIAAKYTELTNEIQLLTTNECLETLSPGVKNAVKKLV